MIDRAALMRSVAAAYTASWNSGDPQKVASHFARDGLIVINRGEPWLNRDGVVAMVAGFYADISDLKLVCDGVRLTGDHGLFLWTFTGTHADSGNSVSVSGWEEWDFEESGLISASYGWFDAEGYASQTTSV